MRPRRQHRLDGVRDREDARFEQDVVTLESARITRAIESFVMLSHGLDSNRLASSGFATGGALGTEFALVGSVVGGAIGGRRRRRGFFHRRYGARREKRGPPVSTRQHIRRPSPRTGTREIVSVGRHMLAA